jgi:hypothetical protein
MVGHAHQRVNQVRDRLFQFAWPGGKDADVSPCRRIRMSTGLECEFFEYRPGEWYYALERDDGDPDKWDWRETAECHGPFDGYETAYSHLRENHANPGGHSRLSYDEAAMARPSRASLVDRAAANMRSVAPSRRFF